MMWNCFPVICAGKVLFEDVIIPVREKEDRAVSDLFTGKLREKTVVKEKNPDLYFSKTFCLKKCY